MFKNKFKSRYMWLFTNGLHYYFISGDRTKDIPASILSEYKGMLCSDGYSPYRNHDNRIRCLAHILRKAKALLQSTDTKAQAFGNIVFLFLTTMFKRVEEARDNNLSSIDYTKELEELNITCNAYLKCTHEKTRLLAVELKNDWDCFFKVLDDTSLPLTNNEAERGLRSLVIYRKISLSTQSLLASTALGMLTSVMTTLKHTTGSILKELSNILSPPKPVTANNICSNERLNNQLYAEAC